MYKKLFIFILLMLIPLSSFSQRYRIRTGYADPYLYPKMRNPVYSSFDGTPYAVNPSQRRVYPKPVQHQTVTQTTPQATSDVDVNIPNSPWAVQENTIVFIIANEDYVNVPKVNYAINDGEVFAKYCNQTLNIPSHNIHMVKNASGLKIYSELSWATNNMSVIGDKCRVILYYSGHGIPDDNGMLYLLPFDGNADDTVNACSLNNIFSMLSNYPSENITVFLDTCFGEIGNSRGIERKAKYSINDGNFVIFSATRNNERAYAYDEKGHGLFTYFLLKKFQESRGGVDYGTLSKYLLDNVTLMSTRINNKTQTPTIIQSKTLSESNEWKKLRLIN